MMYDFHYPLGQGKLNEDTANYCACEEEEEEGCVCRPSLLPSLALSSLLKKEVSGL